ncbi:DUF1456 family protein [Colwellia sp. 12G3]|uniref:DUF1456 family protein n=1 Tax=Colwellia sp. 12G3 TaxID=2058299 RepID=UPI000C3316B1|nr:DUF1456 family protein [Colwellia sp. 12G3]PKI17085.1 DUF1456 domain-containing protein [Colwellia sp. 12G3]
MNNNDVLRKLRYTFNFNDKQMVAIFASAGEEVSREEVSQWLKKDSDSDFVALFDTKLAVFLNGFINEKRGKKPGPQAIPEKRLSNNIILTKLKIALNLQAEQIISLLEEVDFRISKPELSAFSRKVDHQHYRECKDQVLRNLLHAIDKTYHVERTNKIVNPATSLSKVSAGNSKPSSDKKVYAKKKVNKPAPSTPWVEGARPNASNVYVNPNSTTTPKRQRLKLSK